MINIGDGSRASPPTDTAAGESLTPVLICLLGSFVVLKMGHPVHLNGGGKAAALLCFLGLQAAQGSGSEALLHMLWPDSPLHLASQSLHSLVYSLHKLLGDVLGGAAPVVYLDGSYRLNAQAGVVVDIACFDALAEAGDREERAGDRTAAMAAYSKAVSLYRGDLQVPGVGGLHAIIERERLCACYLSLQARLAAYHFSEGQYMVCLQYIRRLLAHDPCREDAHRLAMRCYVRQGERAAALRQYQLCREILQHEFDAEPEPATSMLFEQVRLAPGTI